MGELVETIKVDGKEFEAWVDRQPIKRYELAYRVGVSDRALRRYITNDRSLTTQVIRSCALSVPTAMSEEEQSKLWHDLDMNGAQIEAMTGIPAWYIRLIMAGEEEMPKPIAIALTFLLLQVKKNRAKVAEPV